jgi:hypothetical protein
MSIEAPQELDQLDLIGAVAAAYLRNLIKPFIT